MTKPIEMCLAKVITYHKCPLSASQVNSYLYYSPYLCELRKYIFISTIKHALILKGYVSWIISPNRDKSDRSQAGLELSWNWRIHSCCIHLSGIVAVTLTNATSAFYLLTGVRATADNFSELKIRKFQYKERTFEKHLIAVCHQHNNEVITSYRIMITTSM